MASKKRKPKPKATRRVDTTVWGADGWVVRFGVLKRGVGRPNGTPNLFHCVGEKIPYAALDDVDRHLRDEGMTRQGVYIAHDSMGCPRYVGRGNIFPRLRQHLKAHEDELAYFSFYVVENKNHEREIETLIIRASGFLLQFNERKKRVGIEPGSIRDYEAGTHFFVRQHKKGRKPPKARKKRAA